MPVQFILGRAGAGKTRACLEAVRSRLRSDPIDGPRLILLVPEQASLQMEQAIVAPDDIGAAHRAEVLSFRRLARRMMESGGAARRAVSESSRAMIVRHLLQRHRRSLRYYRSTTRLVGLARRLGDALGELIREGVRPNDMLVPDASGDADPRSTRTPEPESTSRAAKLHDLAMIHAAYEEFLGATRLDASHNLSIAAELIPRCAWLNDSELWVDGFASMSGQERHVLVLLAARCSQVSISMLVDPDAIEGDDANLLGAPTSKAGELFRLTNRSYVQWRRMIRAAGIAELPPVLLRGPAPRFSAPALTALEQGVFTSNGAPPDRNDRSRDEAPMLDPMRLDAAPFHVVMLPNRRVEAEYAVAAIQSWIRASDGKLRYRDVAIITRDLAPYSDVLSAALESRGIPFFLDRRPSLAHHPVVEWLRAMGDLAASPYALEPMRLLLKTGLAPLIDEQADALENYLLEFGIEGPLAWRGPRWEHRSRGDRRGEAPSLHAQRRRAGVNESRDLIVARLDPWVRAAADGSPRTGRDWTSLLLNTLDAWRIGPRLEAWTRSAQEQGRLNEAQEHEQVWPQVTQFLDDLSYAFADTVVTADELGDLLETGLSGLTLGLTPPMVDQVLIGSIERSRHPDIKVAVVIGFNDGQFPARESEDVILNDADRRTLLERGLSIGEPHRERILDEKLLAYVALTRASRRLLVTGAEADEQGRDLRPSPFVAELLPYAAGHRVLRVDDPRRERATWDMQGPMDLAPRLAAEFRARPPRNEDRTDVRTTWNTLYAVARTATLVDDRSRRVLSALAPPAPLGLDRDHVARLYASPLFTSVTALESFAQCPFQYFAKHALKLRERPVARMGPLDLGLLHHAILEDVVRHCAEERVDLVVLSDEDVARRVETSRQRVADAMHQSWEQIAGRDEHVLGRAGMALKEALRVQRAALRAGRTHPCRAEVAFGADTSESLPPLRIVTPAGREVLLRGYIDRVDLTVVSSDPGRPVTQVGVVVDYKSTRRELDLRKVYYGLALQLPVYMIVLREHGARLAHGPVEPIAALFQTLQPAYVRVDHPEDAENYEPATRGFRSARGLIRFSNLGDLEAVAPGQRSKYLNVRVLKESGGIATPDRSDAVDDADFEAVLAFTRRKLGELADAILDGQADAAPCRIGQLNPCANCDYLAACGYEMGVSRTRFLPQPPRESVLDEMKTATQE